ncbi:pyrroline-5-carboxylate reductase [Methylomarinovum caldicuralii]|uniref:Pyrroline-5-carboxylate reductase n=1 Tax=Methylomarinovum caldicuralii TaxID=438856 RepID=A0AAU9C462_9GAMM|nr:pyrroline-5-carboxylate reductase [Methylomarinovum caldicuralii]BCX82528.1 pyrroline-5-carboxylate reductase [Methylomarinovum caldicuralii]
MSQRIGFIGAGNMATSLIGGLIADGYPNDCIRVTDINQNKVLALRQHFGIESADDSISLVETSDIVVLAVKPQQIRALAQEIAPAVQSHRPLVVSIAAGIREADLERWLGGPVPIVRTMPNTPALVQSGATGLHANPHVSETQRDWAESLMRAVGITVWVEREELLDAVTAVSGSGPAYFFLLMEAMEKAAADLGLGQAEARLLVEQTALGAAKLAMETEIGPEALRHRVTSPGGTTEKAIEVFTQEEFTELVRSAIKAAYERAQSLSQQLGEQQ